MSAQDAAAVEGGSAVLGLYYWPQSADTNVHSSPARLILLFCLISQVILSSYVLINSEIFKAFPLLLATTHSGVLVFNAQTMELISMVDFKGIACVVHQIFMQ